MILNTETQRHRDFIFIDLQIYFLRVFVSLCFIPNYDTPSFC